MVTDLAISMVQAPLVWEDKAANLAYFSEQLRHIEGKTDLVVLPETFTTGFSMNAPQLADTMDGETVATLKAWARKYDIGIAGSFIAADGGKYFNRAFLITPETEHYYDKRHLFRMAGETDVYTAGTARPVFRFRGWNICLEVCYDLRFPVWSRNNNKVYDLLIYVANWPRVRRSVWKPLLQARAIENLAYVCGVNRVGTDGKGFDYAGESVVYSPKGELLAECEDGEATTRTVRLSKEKLERFREKFPAWMDEDEFQLIIHHS